MNEGTRELELKYKLPDRDAYEKLRAALGRPQEEFEQVNYYFQSPDGSIPGDRGVIRIRAEKGRLIFTVKLGSMVEEGLTDAREFEEPWKGTHESLPPAPEDFWQSGYRGMRELERSFGRRCPLEWAGSMTNFRSVYSTADGLRLEVDASRYPDGSQDFEVELETGNPGRDRIRLLTLLTQLGVSCSTQTATKYQRFLAHRQPAKPRPV